MSCMYAQVEPHERRYWFEVEPPAPESRLPLPILSIYDSRDQRTAAFLATKVTDQQDYELNPLLQYLRSLGFRTPAAARRRRAMSPLGDLVRDAFLRASRAHSRYMQEHSKTKSCDLDMTHEVVAQAGEESMETTHVPRTDQDASLPLIAKNLFALCPRPHSERPCFSPVRCCCCQTQSPSPLRSPRPSRASSARSRDRKSVV